MLDAEETSGPDVGALWYKDACIYQLHVRAFQDSNGDGSGDFRGLTRRLDYLQDLGVTAIWLLPFYPSPLKDDGYDIGDYAAVHQSYGSLRDFKIFLQEAHRRGLKVITELVINHTSDQHAWFQRARTVPAGSPWRKYYVWSDTPERYEEARIIFKDFESSNWAWDPVAKSYYWHRFYSHQPDLNFDHSPVRKSVFAAMDFWLKLGVDGLRLDAIPYLFERDGTSCENLPETHSFLKDLRCHVDQNFKDRMLLAEANQWPEDAVAYFGNSDECHMAFNFPLMPRLFMSIRMEDRFPVIDILQHTPEIPELCQWAIFLRNHDELTLEMVTDEERDYMYRVYAHDPQMRINLGIRRRLAPLLGNNRRRIELMNGLLFSLPGTPVIYYGDEIGMGDNIYLGDRNGVRTPMQWSADRNAGFSRANPQQLYLPVIIDPEYHHETVNVEAQQNNPHSLLWWMKRVIALRKRYKAFSRGTLEFLLPENNKVLAFIRRFENEHILVVANISRFAQSAELDLAHFKGSVPVELFGQTKFPQISEHPYILTLGPHSFYWFSLVPQQVTQPQPVGTPEPRLPVITSIGRWDAVLQEKRNVTLQRTIADYIRGRRWFGSKARTIQRIEVHDAMPVARGGEPPWAYLTLLRIEYVEREAEIYTLPLAFASGGQMEQVLRETPEVGIGRLDVRRGLAGSLSDSGLLYDAQWDPQFAGWLLDVIARRRRVKGLCGELVAFPTHAFRKLRASSDYPMAPAPVRAEQSNTSIAYGDRFFLKLYRRPGIGKNPDFEIGSFLSNSGSFPYTPTVAGAIEYRRGSDEVRTLALLQELVPNEGDAWSYTLDSIGEYLERATTRAQGTLIEPTVLQGGLLDPLDAESPSVADEMVGTYLATAELLGQRTAELHLALASNHKDPDFTPEPFTVHYRHSIYQSMRSLTNQSFRLLNSRLHSLPDSTIDLARSVLAREGDVYRRMRHVTDRSIQTIRIRCHGDYHLGQVLFTGKDFVIIDFEGEPARAMSERRIKRSPLRDVAGMLRSFHYACNSALYSHEESAVRPDEEFDLLESWAQYWYLCVGRSFLKSYLTAVADTPIVPSSRENLRVLLNAFLLEKAVYELSYELNNRPTWVRIPLKGILQLLETPA